MHQWRSSVVLPADQRDKPSGAVGTNALLYRWIERNNRGIRDRWWIGGSDRGVLSVYITMCFVLAFIAFRRGGEESRAVARAPERAASRRVQQATRHFALNAVEVVLVVVRKSAVVIIILQHQITEFARLFGQRI